MNYCVFTLPKALAPEAAGFTSAMSATVTVTPAQLVPAYRRAVALHEKITSKLPVLERDGYPLREPVYRHRAVRRAALACRLEGRWPYRSARQAFAKRYQYYRAYFNNRL